MKPEEIETCRKAFTFIQRKGSIQASQLIPPYDIKQDPEAVGVFEKLPQVIPDSIIEQVKKFKNSLHCIFIKNDDYDLTLGIVSFIYYTHANGSFTYLPYSGYTDQEIVSDLFPPDPPNKYKLDYYLRGRTLFISGIGSEHQSVFKRLLGAFKGINFSNPYGKEFGFLIINIDNIASVPGELSKLSDIINLEPEQPGVSRAPIKAVKKKQTKKLFYTWKKDKIVLFLKNESIPVELTKQETDLFNFLRTDRRTIGEIAGEIWKVYRDADIKNKTSNIGELRRRINEKCEKFVPEGIISEMDNDSYCLTVEVEEGFLSDFLINSKLRKQR